MTEEYSFECGTHTWIVVSASSMVIDRSVGIEVYDVGVHTTSDVEESSLLGHKGRLTRGHVMLAESLILRATFLGLEHGRRTFRVLVQSMAHTEPSPPPFERPAHGHVARAPHRPWVDATEKIHKGEYVVNPYDDPLYRQTTEPLVVRTREIFEDAEGTVTLPHRRHKTETINRDEMKRLHLVKCRGNGSGLAGSSVVDGSARPGEGRVLRELVEVFYDRDRAVFLLLSAGFPRGMMPEFGNPLAFWTRVVEEVHHGVLVGGLATIMVRAAELYPSNRVFAARESGVRCG